MKPHLSRWHYPLITYLSFNKVHFLFRPLFSVYGRNWEIFSFFFLGEIEDWKTTGDIFFLRHNGRQMYKLKDLLWWFCHLNLGISQMHITFMAVFTFAKNFFFFFVKYTTLTGDCKHDWAWKERKMFFTQSVQYEQYEQQCKSQLAADVSLSAKQV